MQESSSLSSSLPEEVIQHMQSDVQDPPPSDNDMQDAPPIDNDSGLHPNGTRCPFFHARGDQALSPATAKVDQRGIYHPDGTRCPMFAFLKPKRRSAYGDSSSSEDADTAVRTSNTAQGSDSNSIDTDVELESVLDSLTVPNINSGWIQDSLFPFLRKAYGQQTLVDGIKDNSILRALEQADMLAAVM
jgi:hypothetical protein